MPADQVWADVYFTARDGLRLYARHYPAPPSPRKPVLCLAGLTRNSRDFHDLAAALSRGPAARSVWALDSRGRGLSEHDPNWKNYTLPVEMHDVIDLVTLAGLHGAAVVGTSRGGLIAMLLSAVQPTVLGAVVLNDIGPVIERAGIERIAGYVGRTPAPASWAEAAELLAAFNAPQFPAVPREQWEEVARAWFNDVEGRPAPGYDARLGKTFSLKNGQIPTLWPQFAGLARTPLLVLRGENSDILSEATVQEMRAGHSDCATLTVEGQGHAPLLKDAPTIAAIAKFLQAADAASRRLG